jgi:hypothetical protein
MVWLQGDYSHWFLSWFLTLESRPRKFRIAVHAGCKHAAETEFYSLCHVTETKSCDLSETSKWVEINERRHTTYIYIYILDQSVTGVTSTSGHTTVRSVKRDPFLLDM